MINKSIYAFENRLESHHFGIINQNFKAMENSHKYIGRVYVKTWKGSDDVKFLGSVGASTMDGLKRAARAFCVLNNYSSGRATMDIESKKELRTINFNI